MDPIRETCTLRPEVLKGDLEDALFAADFGHVIVGIAPPVYQDPVVFFRNTHPAAPLKRIISTIFGRLADPNEAGATVRLSTGFGGGKTHTLIALWHLARNIAHTSLGTDLLPAAGRPKKVIVAGIDASSFGGSICGKHDGLETHSLWGELAYQLGGVEGYNRLATIDDPRNPPDAGTLRGILPDEPTLILLDELVIYMAHLNDQERNALLAFVNRLMAEVSARHQTMLVITDPAGQPAYQRVTQQLAQEMAAAARVLDDVLGRKVGDENPIGDETAEVIIRRLFEHINREAADKASAEYYAAYRRISEENPGTLPPEAATADYARQLLRCYPFHPRLLETARDRLGALQDFNKSRGMLRLFARFLRDVWEKKPDLCLITAGDLDWTSPRMQADLLQRLPRDRFVAAVNADVVLHAGQLDTEFSTDIHRRVASALLLESLPLSATSAMDKRDLALAVLRPSDVGHEPGEAIDRLMSVCWHTYRDQTGTRYQFRYEPNANKIIEERAGAIPYEDAKQGALTVVQNYFRGHTFQLVPYPSSPKAVADGADLQLVLGDSEPLVQRVCDYQDDSDPEAKYPRRFRNAIFGVAPTPSLLEDAIQTRRRLLAAEAILNEERQKGHGGRGKSALQDQVEPLVQRFRLRARQQAWRAFNRVVFQGRRSLSLSEKYLVSSEGALTDPIGQAKLKDFLDDNGLVYQPNETLDVDLFLDEILSGATPSLEHEGAYLASAVHERALAHPRLRLMLDAAPVRNTILRAVKEGRLVIRRANGEAYDADGCVSGPPGARRRDSDTMPYTLALTDDVLLALPDAPCVPGWLRVDDVPPVGSGLSIAEAAAQRGVSDQVVSDALDLGELTVIRIDGARKVAQDVKWAAWSPRAVSGSERVTANSWDDAVRYAATRPLLSLSLSTTNSVTASKLVAIAQPFGAQALTLSVMASGELKDGGRMNFAVNGARHNSPLKPIDTAKRLLRAAHEDTASFRGELILDFGGNEVRGSQSNFERARASAGTQVQLTAEFGPEEATDA